MALFSIFFKWPFCCSVTSPPPTSYVTIAKTKRQGHAVIPVFSFLGKTLIATPHLITRLLQTITSASPSLLTPAPTCLLSSINRVTHCLHVLASHCVCGPEPAKQPYHLHFSIFIVDIYFCNYLSTSPSAEDDMLKLTLPLPSLSLLLLTHKHTDRGSNGQMYTDMKKRGIHTVWWMVSSTIYEV